MTRSACLVVVAMLLSLTACGKGDDYHVNIYPEGASFRRQLTTTSKSPHLAEIYGQPHDDGSYQATFTGETPQDIGGAGFLQRFGSAMGDLSLYVEHFRGRTDLHAQIDEQLTAADDLIDLFIGYIDTHLPEHPQHEQLRKLCDTDVRNDYKDLVVMMWMLQRQDMPDEKQDFPMWRILQLIAERGYCPPERLPELIRRLTSHQGDEHSLTSVLQMFARHKLGIKHDDPANPLAFMDDREQLTKSFYDFVATTQVYRQNAQPKDDTEPTERMNPEDFVELLFHQSLTGAAMSGLFTFTTPDPVRVTLHVPGEPIEHNGQWNEPQRQITWSGKLKVHNETRPLFCFARWVEPNHEFQKMRFGRTALTGESLAAYVMWYHGLTQAQAAEWDLLMASLKPGADLLPQITAFRFSTDPPVQPDDGDKPTPSHADEPRQLLLKALKPPESPPAQ